MSKNKLSNLKPIGNNVIIKVIRKDIVADNSALKKSGFIADVAGSELKQKCVKDREPLVKEQIVFAIGSKVTEVKVGDRVRVEGHVFNKQIILKNIYPDIEVPEKEEYYWGKEEDISFII